MIPGAGDLRCHSCRELRLRVLIARATSLLFVRAWREIALYRDDAEVPISPVTGMQIRRSRGREPKSRGDVDATSIGVG
jgi:hypothetical protein